MKAMLRRRGHWRAPKPRAPKPPVGKIRVIHCQATPAPSPRATAHRLRTTRGRSSVPRPPDTARSKRRSAAPSIGEAIKGCSANDRSSHNNDLPKDFPLYDCAVGLPRQDLGAGASPPLTRRAPRGLTQYPHHTNNASTAVMHRVRRYRRPARRHSRRARSSNISRERARSHSPQPAGCSTHFYIGRVCILPWRRKRGLTCARGRRAAWGGRRRRCRTC
jgi:hypothetical protein